MGPNFWSQKFCHMMKIWCYFMHFSHLLCKNWKTPYSKMVFCKMQFPIEHYPGWYFSNWTIVPDGWISSGLIYKWPITKLTYHQVELRGYQDGQVPIWTFYKLICFQVGQLPCQHFLLKSQSYFFPLIGYSFNLLLLGQRTHLEQKEICWQKRSCAIHKSVVLWWLRQKVVSKV